MADMQVRRNEGMDDGLQVSTVRQNLLTRLGYTPYCGGERCYLRWPRTTFNGSQFACRCGWRSRFEPDFIEQYKAAQAKLKADLDAHPVTPASGVDLPDGAQL
jgi:hypothetical protein